jgi:hypothetical protein
MTQNANQNSKERISADEIRFTPEHADITRQVEEHRE